MRMADETPAWHIQDGFFGNMQRLLMNPTDSSHPGMLDNFVQSVSASLTTQIQPVLLTALTIYFMCKAWSIMYGTSQDSLRQVTMNCIKIAFITALFCNAGIFYTYIADTIFSLDTYFAPILMNGNSFQGTNSFTTIDWVFIQTFSNAGSQLTYIFDQVFSINPLMVVKGLVIGSVLGFSFLFLIVMALIASMIAFIMLITNTIGLAFMLALGPLFGALAMFPQTKQLFTSWLKTCLTFAMTKVFLMASLVLLVKIMEYTMGFAGTEVDDYFASFSDWNNAQTAEDAAKAAGDIVAGPFAMILTIASKLVMLGLILLAFSFLIAKSSKFATSIIGGLEMGHGLGNVAQLADRASQATGSNSLTSKITNKAKGMIFGAPAAALKAPWAGAKKVGRLISGLKGSGLKGGSGHP